MAIKVSITSRICIDRNEAGDFTVVRLRPGDPVPDEGTAFHVRRVPGTKRVEILQVEDVPERNRQIEAAQLEAVVGWDGVTSGPPDDDPVDFTPELFAELDDELAAAVMAWAWNGDLGVEQLNGELRCRREAVRAVYDQAAGATPTTATDEDPTTPGGDGPAARTSGGSDSGSTSESAPSSGHDGAGLAVVRSASTNG